ncbi:hypothetical protein [Pseudonocardia asaccharolytica]|uniref:TetR family transcriptional regulator n=1 Tax=Pseudonocardia asaccharolytica DSM 44247 = NBRC 16224 TaxID=1123024 RepID=A0A511D8C5_9PSEU|nr:hypothetical protein [Pseudonocardia asaccharolytica]GEL19188.1 hypothetical protein PA7_30250 [Pseudonocardia asaccharolytica DSM 44247 = NBRC 16224]
MIVASVPRRRLVAGDVDLPDLIRRAVGTVLVDDLDIPAKAQAVLGVIHRTLTKDPAQALFMFVAREEARRHEELAETAGDRVFAGLFAEIVDEAVAAGEIDAADAEATCGALMVIALGLAGLGSDITVAAHRTVTEGCKLLIADTPGFTPVGPE